MSILISPYGCINICQFNISIDIFGVNLNNFFIHHQCAFVIEIIEVLHRNFKLIIYLHSPKYGRCHCSCNNRRNNQYR